MYGNAYGTTAYGDSGSTGKFYSQEVSDSIEFSDSIIRGVIKSVDETLHISEAIQSAWTLRRTITDNISVSDTFSYAMVYLKIVTDRIAVSASISRVIAFARTLTENISTSDTLSSIKTYGRTFTENLAISEAITKTKMLVRIISDSIEFSDVIIVNVLERLRNAISIMKGYVRIGKKEDKPRIDRGGGR